MLINAFRNINIGIFICKIATVFFLYYAKQSKIVYANFQIFSSLSCANVKNSTAGEFSFIYLIQIRGFAHSFAMLLFSKRFVSSIVMVFERHHIYVNSPMSYVDKNSIAFFFAKYKR